MNTRRNANRRLEEAAAGVNQAPPQALAAKHKFPNNLFGILDEEVRAALLQMAHAITVQAQDIRVQATR